MTEKKVSGLSDHKLKKGILISPFNSAIGNRITLSSWSKERMPEYLWLGLILMGYGRNPGIELAGKILFEISKLNNDLTLPRLSNLFSLPVNEQKNIYETILKYVEKDILAPLTLLYPFRLYPIFNEFFFISHLLVEDRIQTISDAIELFSPHQSDEATDLRFLALSFMIFNNKIQFSKNIEQAIIALKEYPYTSHSDEKMRIYRPTVRSMEISTMNFEENDSEFSLNFWKDFGMITPCNEMKINFPQNSTDYKEFIIDCRKILEFVLHSNKEKSLSEDKFDVITGSINYALKIFTEINDKSLDNSILGRHGIRTIIEVFIMLKYLLKREKDKPEIWLEYKLYGISKYKLSLLKVRENDLDSKSHLIMPVIEAIVNEIKWEEFIDVDLKYFDKQGIREKSIDVGEKELYDLFYDYDSNYSHGLWGAVRESSLLKCNNASHQYHNVPDIYDNQNLPDVKVDSYKIIIRIFILLASLYDLPIWFIENYLKNDDAKFI